MVSGQRADTTSPSKCRLLERWEIVSRFRERGFSANGLGKVMFPSRTTSEEDCELGSRVTVTRSSSDVSGSGEIRPKAGTFTLDPHGYKSGEVLSMLFVGFHGNERGDC